MSKILLVEDDVELCSYLEQWLRQESLDFESAQTGEAALQLLSRHKFDLIVLDWDLPDLPGIEICRRYRADGGNAAVIFLTGRGAIDSKESGFDSGADDYMVKPFDVRELGARIRSLLRRPKQVLLDLNINGVTLDTKSRLVKSGTQTQKLMPKECALLEFLMRHPNTIHSTKNLLDAVWRSDSETSEDTARSCMRTLRGKLKNLGRDDLITTRLGSGYIIEVKP